MGVYRKIINKFFLKKILKNDKNKINFDAMKYLEDKYNINKNKSVIDELFKLWKKHGDIIWDGVNDYLYDSVVNKSIDNMVLDILESRDIHEGLIDYLKNE